MTTDSGPDVVAATDYPDGSRDEWTATEVWQWDADRVLVERRPLSAAEAAEVKAVVAGRAAQEKQAQAKSDLWKAALSVYQRNTAFTTAATTTVFPLPLDQQKYLVATVADLCTTVNGLLKLLDDKGLIT